MQLVDQAVRDYKELGRVSPNASYTPPIDKSTMEVLERRVLRKTLERAYANTTYYSRLAEEKGIKKVSDRNLSSLPLTTKSNLRGKENEFIDVESKDTAILFSSTGTTGWPPSSVWMGRSEMEMIAASNAFFLVSKGYVLPGSLVQFAMVSRAGLTTWANIEACKRIGAPVVHTGVIDPEECLRLLSTDYGLKGERNKVSILFTYPSYLDLLVERGKSMGFGPKDFDLRTIVASGEVFTLGTRRRVADFFGAQILEIYNISECIQVAGTVCSQGNLHFTREGRVEVLDPDTLEEVSEQECGVLTFTPYRPPREITLLVRYATSDVVRRLEGCNCELALLPAFSKPLGKYDKGLATCGLTYRDLLELLENVEGVSHPLRVSLNQEKDESFVLHLSAENDDEVTARVEEAYRKKNLHPPKVVLHRTGESFAHYPIRCDLRELTFSSMKHDNR